MAAGRSALTDGQACHSIVVWLPGTVPVAEIRQRLATAATRWPAVGRLRLWETPVGGSLSDPAARDRAEREALRPVRDGANPVRVVLLRGTDAANLVLVARRGRVPRALLDGLARAALGDASSADIAVTDAEPPAVSWPAVDWGLGDPGRTGSTGQCRLVLPGGAIDGRWLLLGAVALTLGAYSGRHEVEIGQLDQVSGAERVTLLRVAHGDDALGVADYLAELAAVEPTATGAEVPEVGIVVTGPGDGTYTPCLAPVFPMTLHGVACPDGGFTGWCRLDEGLVSPAVAKTFIACVERVAAALVSGTGTVSDIRLLDDAAEASVLRLGGAGTDVPAGGRIDMTVADIARERPDAVAVVDEDGELTYRELDTRAGRVAAGLRALGVAPGTMVGVCLDRGAPLIVALLGVLKAGCAYVPMESRTPPDRLRYITEDAQLALVIGDPETFPTVPGVRVAPLTELPTNDTSPGNQGTVDDTAYVIYTSGSTGRPKGVLVPHRNVTALINATTTEFTLGPHDVWTMFHSSAFDFSVWELWGCLLTGGRLVVVSSWVTRDTDAFHRLLAARRVTVLSQTPSAFAQLVRTDRQEHRDLAVRLVVFGGEPLDVRMLAPWLRGHSHTRCRLVNMFGITETTVHVTAQTITPAEVAAGSRSVGRALPGWSVSVRDSAGRVLPPGAVGEIHVAGVGVADGYLRRPELTAERFVVDPATGVRRYRSGDRGRLHPDGRLDHLGRIDNQVKIRGYRIELDEIRSVLVNDLGATAAAVTVNQAVPGDPASSRIDAYVVLATGGHVRELARGARRILPDYMTPVTITEIPAIPLTENGKPDFAKLPAPSTPDTTEPDTTPSRSADGDLTDEILQIWTHCLRTEVTRKDNFFELGGNSLLVERMLASMRERRLPKVSARDFYTNSTAGQFIDLVNGLHAAAAMI